MTSALPGKTQAEKDVEVAHQELANYVKDLEGRLINMTDEAKNLGKGMIESANEALNDKALDEVDLRSALQMMQDGESSLVPKAATKEKKQEGKQFKSADICKKAYKNYLELLTRLENRRPPLGGM